MDAQVGVNLYGFHTVTYMIKYNASVNLETFKSEEEIL